MDENINIRDLISSFFRQFKMFMLVFISAVTIGALFIAFAEKQYISTGSLLIKFGASAEAGINKDSDREIISSNDRREVMQSNIDILGSNDLLREVIEKVGIENVYPNIEKEVKGRDVPLEAAIKRLKTKHLSIKSGSQSNVINVIVFNKSPKVAKKLVETIQSVFITRQMETFNKPHTDFLLEQVNGAKGRLDLAQKELHKFKSETGISSFDEEINELLKQKSNALTVAFQSVDDAQNKIANLRNKEAELLSTYRASSPAVRSIRKTIVEAERQLKERQSNLNSKDGVLSAQLAGIYKRINDLENRRSRYNNLERQVELEEANYKNYLTKSEEARISENLGKKKITRVVIIDSPKEAIKPARPRKLLGMAVAILAGILFGGAAVLVLELLDDRFRNTRQLGRAMEVPAFAYSSKSSSKDKLVSLFNSIDYAMSGVKCPVIQIASSYSREGAEEVAKQLTSLATEQGKKVMLINSKELQEDFSRNTEEFIRKGDGSWIIISSPDLLNDRMGQSLIKLSSGSVLVVEAERTRAPVAGETGRLITSLGGRVISSVLVNRRFYIPNLVYGLLYRTKKA
ncbi:MAG: GNVR domain-containing protein [Rickettsiales bacterium]